LVVDAGSGLEDDDQRGLAHFVEHLAVNGTERFRHIAPTAFIRRFGPRAGAHYNGHTGRDRVVYELTVPAKDITAVAGAFQIQRDWLTGLRFDPLELESERGVVLEEWRLVSWSQNTCHIRRHLRQRLRATGARGNLVCRLGPLEPA
jgi:zinc protease